MERAALKQLFLVGNLVYFLEVLILACSRDIGW